MISNWISSDKERESETTRERDDLGERLDHPLTQLLADYAHFLRRTNDPVQTRLGSESEGSGCYFEFNLCAQLLDYLFVNSELVQL